MLYKVIHLLQMLLIFNIVLLIASYDIELKYKRRHLPVYWNAPSFQCDPFQLNFSKILEKYDIIQNRNARFRGEKLVILYDPGNFPAILKKGKEMFLRNGGIPQKGNLTSHLEIFTDILQQLIPAEDFSGLGIIDFESWRPVYRQNWGNLLPYKTLSEDLEKQKHPLWPYGWIRKEATKVFEESAKIFMEDTLNLARSLRPNATWGYYHYPYCFNMVVGNMVTHCTKEVLSENDRITWLYNQSDNLYPSVYLQESYTVTQHIQLIEGRLDETLRIKKGLNGSQNIYVYYWYKYQDTGNFLSKEDLFVTLTVLASYNIDGLILWGASADVNSRENCLRVYDYIDKVFGPIVKHV